MNRDAPRLAQLDPADLDPDQIALYQAITAGPRSGGPQLFDLTDSAGRLTGPFNAMLLSPPVGQALQSLGAAIRFGTGFSARVREMAILAVAAHWDCAFEQQAHEAIGRHIGLSDEEVASLREGGRLDLPDPAEAAALEVVRALLSPGDLDDEAYARARRLLGERALFELSTLVGYYSTLSLQLRLFRAE